MSLPVPNYPDYTVYEDGRIWSNKTNKFLKPNYTERGYASIELFNSDGHRRFLIHRLVANAFIPNPHNLPQVNHKDENPTNNAASNLEWCTAKYNMNYGIGAKVRHLKIDYTKPIFKETAIKNGKKVSRPVAMIDKFGTPLATYASAVDASKATGIYKTSITRSTRSTHLRAGGYKWEYVKGV